MNKYLLHGLASLAYILVLPVLLTIVAIIGHGTFVKELTQGVEEFDFDNV